MSRSIQAIIVTGVSGSGKSTIAEALARRLNWLYEDGDDFHPQANIEKMKAGQALTDADRGPWLALIAEEIDRQISAGKRIVIACSALKRRYRDALVRGRGDIAIVFLEGSAELIAGRVAARTHHFMPPALLESQFETLEIPQTDEHPIFVPIDGSVAKTVAQIVRQLSDRSVKATI